MRRGFAVMILLIAIFCLPGLQAAAHASSPGAVWVNQAQRAEARSRAAARHRQAEQALSTSPAKPAGTNDSIAAALDKGGSTSWSIVVGLTHSSKDATKRAV